MFFKKTNLSINPVELDQTADHLLELAFTSDKVKDHIEELNERMIKAVLPEFKLTEFLTKDVPIFKISSRLDTLVVSSKEENQSAFFAYGQLIGKFYEGNQIKFLPSAAFVGEFEGMFEWPKPDEDPPFVFFQGEILNMQLLTKPNHAFLDEDINLISNYESSFHGYFKGFFFPWSVVGGLDNILTDTLVYQSTKVIPSNFDEEYKRNWNFEAKRCITQINQKTEYILPVLIRFGIKNFGDINLDKSKAVINGDLHLSVRYNDEIDGLIEQYNEKGLKPAIHLNFNRDITLILPLCDNDNSSEDSEWSIQDRVWDIQFHKNKQAKTYDFKIQKRFSAEIDNSYGAFFAPFNLSRLKIVVGLAPLYFHNHGIKVTFSCTDTLQFDEKGPYNPFAGFHELGKGDPPTARQINRYHKVNRHWCNDSGEYIIADNLLTLYPHYKVILLNKSFIIDDSLWGLGLRDCLHLFDPPLAKNIPAAFHYLKANKEADLQINKHKFFTFSFLRWNHAIIEIPIYKYIVIDMIKIFVPLTIITIISLFIFHQENGIASGSQFTTLAYRLVNIAAIAIVYVSMIPIIRSSLPAMPGITLIEIITYLETLPSLLSIINSMIYYTTPQAEWQSYYSIFHDWLFLFGFALSLLNLVVFLVVLIVYKMMKYRCSWKIGDYDESLVKWRSPYYLKFMDSIRIHKTHYFTLTEQQQ